MKKTLTLLLTFSLFLTKLLYSQSTELQQTQADKVLYPTLKPAGFFQQHFTLDNIAENPAHFSIYRARFGFKGSVNEKIKYNLIMGAVEPPNRTPALVNAFIDFEFHPAFNLRTGQFLVPFGLEGPEPIFLNPAIERAFPTRKLNTYRMFRDIGINIHGRYSIIHYSLSILNGEGANIAESINPKDFVLRLNFNLTDQFTVGLSGQTGSYETDSLDIFSRQRLGAHFEYIDHKAKNRFRGEFIYLEKQIEENEHEISMGGYLLYGYKFSEKFESIARVEYYQPDDHDNTYNGLTLGSNYYITGKTRLSLNFTAFNNIVSLNEMNYGINLQLQYVL